MQTLQRMKGQNDTSEGENDGSSSKQDFVQRSSLYQEFLAEREEILRHKWIESEKAGEDIGFEKALLDWIRKHRESWRKKRKAELEGTSTDEEQAS